MNFPLATLALSAYGADFSSSLRDFAPSVSGDPVVVVVTPGFEITGFLPLIDTLRKDGRDVYALQFGCEDMDRAGLSAIVAETVASFDDPPVVVAHGLGAILALDAAAESEPEKLVLLAPILDFWPILSSKSLAGRGEWNTLFADAELAARLLGTNPPPLGCSPAPWTAEVRGWIRDSDVPLRLEEVRVPVWMAVSLGDDLAAVEAVVAASRKLADREAVRLGLNRMDAQDYDHGEMLTAKVPVHAAMKAAR